MRIAIASGKGGTGKTTLAVNLARVAGPSALLLDCDVEAPNDHLFLQGKLTGREIVTIPRPEVDKDLCQGCGECSRFCAYNALVLMGRHPLLFPELCHGCGGCTKICPQGAIRETPHRIGVVETFTAGGVNLVQGRLDVGSTMAPPLIRAVQTRAPAGVPTILDAPPGTSCPVVATLRDADYVVLVSEPTPFGLHDLELAVDMVRQIGLPFGVVINRVGIGDDRLHDFCNREGVSVLMEIPDDRRIAEAYSRGDLVVEALPGYRGRFEQLRDRLLPARVPAQTLSAGSLEGGRTLRVE